MHECENIYLSTFNIYNTSIFFQRIVICESELVCFLLTLINIELWFLIEDYICLSVIYVIFVPYMFYPILFVNLNAFLFHMNEFWCSIMMMTKTSRHNTSCLHLTRKCLLEEAWGLKWRADWRIKCLFSEKNKKAPTGHGSNSSTSKLMLSNI